MLPNATETRIVVTGNYRAWRHFIAIRATSTPTSRSAGWPSSACANCIDVAPKVFADFKISTLADGTEMATSPLATEA